MYEELFEKMWLQDIGLAGFIYLDGRVDEFNPEEEHEEKDAAGAGALEYRIWPAGIAGSEDVLTIRLYSPLSLEQISSLNKLLRSTDYTIVTMELELLSSQGGGPKSAQIAMSKDWPRAIRKMYEVKLFVKDIKYGYDVVRKT